MNTEKANFKLNKNIIANYFGQIYTIIIAIMMVPLYLQFLGAEAYGLVAFFALMHSWMTLLDMGIVPALSREVAKARANNNGGANFKSLLHSLEIIFICLSLIVSGTTIFFSAWLAENWLNITSLDISVVSYCISLMGFLVGFRFLSSLYRAGITGAEEQVWLNVANVVIVTLKFGGATLVLYLSGGDVEYFFEYQAVIAIFEVIILAMKFYKIMDIGRFQLYFSADIIRPIMPFALGIGYTSGIWVFLTQFDKLLLSGILPLNEYGYFAMVGMVSAAILQLMAPIGQALQPRMIALISQNKEAEMLVLYRKYTQYMVITIFSVAGVISVFSYEILYSWSGSLEVSKWGEDILFWYAFGNAILAIAGFQYGLQFAYGKIKMHVWYNSIVVIISVPLIFWSAHIHGAIGVAIAWFSLRLVGFLLWVPFVHHKFVPGLHQKWLLEDIMPCVIATLLFFTILDYINISFNYSRSVLFIMLLLIGCCLLFVNSLASSEGRSILMKILVKKA